MKTSLMGAALLGLIFSVTGCGTQTQPAAEGEPSVTPSEQHEVLKPELPAPTTESGLPQTTGAAASEEQEPAEPKPPQPQETESEPQEEKQPEPPKQEDDQPEPAEDN